MLRHLQPAYDRWRLRRLLASGIPSYLKLPFDYLATPGLQLPSEVQSKRKLVEHQRTAMLDSPLKQVSIYYSPKPESSGTHATATLRPEHGEVMEFDIARIASHTSISTYWGTFLHLLASSAASKNILELGTCAGISGCYLSSVPTCQNFWTIEASEGLSNIARKNLAAISDKATVFNGLFDDVLDDLLPELGEKKLDFVWIDGHHERVATIHYFQRLIPHLSKGAIVLFDDVSWSADMRQSWEELAHWPGFEYTFDLKTLKGLGIWSGGETVPRFDFVAKPFGKIHLGDPQGWKTNASNQHR
ncbi:O-methyltransferase [Rosistilla oblonga]|uniref:O-methyltransferase n=1 Tax=Rosistilla oblonga TaxID=2527990 RepID=A0A518J1V5_9BACT|nr:class I SAM-dependent methyltransferase [Rosistilla oblonga]QDV59319.1 O-methyltransferase [Rosistilla oblonga]